MMTFFNGFGQAQLGITTTPNGMFDNVYDRFGNHYNIEDIKIDSGELLPGVSSRPILLSCGTNSIFNLWFDDNSGMQGSSTIEIQRRAVICQVFQDVSNFINTPLKTRINPTTGFVDRVNIWVMNSPTDPVILGQASDFYNTPQTPTVINGGIIDGEVWKTLHTGRNSWENVASPLNSGFYHGTLAINWNHNWNLSLLTGATGSDFDLYTVVLHEVLHSLGFASLIGADGFSILGVGNNYYTRYDTLLRTPSNQNLIANTGSCSVMYNYNFNVSSNSIHPSTPALGTDHTNCPTAIRYVGTSTGTVLVYTPTNYENGSSLSHFEDECLVLSQNNSFFVMSNANGPASTKRFIKNQERNALGELGYCLNTSYGIPTTPSFISYSGATVTQGVRVAGINDGLLATSYAFTGATGTDIAITGVLLNDIITNAAGVIINNPNLLRFQCVEDVYYTTNTTNPVLTTDTFTKITTNGNLNTSTITFRSMVPGLHLLRYVPYLQTSTVNIGNICYIFVFVTNNCAIPDVCNLVLNGGFEQKSFAPIVLGQIDFACNWSNGRNSTSSDYFRTNTNAIVGVPNNINGNQPVNNGIGNAYAGLWSLTNFQELLKTTLTNPLANNTNYQLSFDVAIYNANSKPLNPSEIQACFTNNSIPILNVSIPQTNELFMGTGQVVTANTPNNWRTITFNFTTTNGGQQDLYIGGIRNANFQTPPNLSIGSGAYYYIDNVQLFATNNYMFNLPPTICSTSTIPNLSTFLSLGTPPNGVFTGAGVMTTGTTPNIIYSFNPSGLAGLQSITYTYISGGCTIPLSDTINVVSFGIVTNLFASSNPNISASFSSTTVTIANAAGSGFVNVMTNDNANGILITPANLINYTTNISGTVSPQPNFGSITLNPNGTINVGANTTPGTYSFNYNFTDGCATSNNALVVVTINAPNILVPSKTTLGGFCYTTTPYTTTMSILDNVTINNLPATQYNCTIQQAGWISPMPTGLTINANGTVNVIGGMQPDYYQIPFVICPLGSNTGCSTIMYAGLNVDSTVNAGDDFIIVHPDGTPTIGSPVNYTVNVLTGNSGAVDYYSCPFFSQVPATLSNIGSVIQTSPSNTFYEILLNGNINYKHPMSGGFPLLMPVDNQSQILEYKICDPNFPLENCSYAHVYINVWAAGSRGVINSSNNSFNEHKNIVVQPNPSSDIFKIRFSQKTSNATISIYNLLGQKIVETITTDETNFELDLNNYPTGTYMLKIATNDQIYTEKLIKQ